MTVKELIELNQRITDVQITVRYKGSRLLDQLNIGCHEGVKPPYPTRVPLSAKYIDNFAVLDPKHHRDATYIPKSINAWDDGKDYWQVKVDRIPTKWRDLEVIGWDSSAASTVGTTSPKRGRTNFHGERIRINVLANGESLEVKQPETREPEEEPIDGQISIADWLKEDNV